MTRLEAAITLSATFAVASLLLPTLAQAPKSWTQEDEKNHISCMSNLKTIALGMLLYNQDYYEWHPPVASRGTRAYGWSDLLHPDYVRDRQTFQCPSERNNRNDNPRQRGYSDYWYNRNFAGKNIIVIDMVEGTTQPIAQTIMLGDGDGGYDNSNSRYAINALPKSWIETANSPAKRHLEGANYAFPDGHVKWLRPNQISASASSNRESAYNFEIPRR